MILWADDSAIAQAGRFIREGGLVAFPTETVYGLGADATNGRAVARIFEAKGRPSFNPLIVHVAGIEAARALARFDEVAEKLAARFWPGPLTLVLPRSQSEYPLSALVAAGLDTVGLRIPRGAVARALIREAGRPIAAPSANLSGRTSATAASHVLADLGGLVDLILDGGPTEAGLESTIVGLSGRPVLLRAGAIPREEIEALLGSKLASPRAGTVQSPGRLRSHYAPRAPLRMNAAAARPGELLLGFGPHAQGCALNLSPSGDLREAAANLFAYIRSLDARNPEAIAVMPVPQGGLGEAINDRLRRASAVPDESEKA